LSPAAKTESPAEAPTTPLSPSINTLFFMIPSE
jgi:hypothetical protein